MSIIEWFSIFAYLIIFFCVWQWTAKDAKYKVFIKYLWTYGTNKPIQRIGLIFLIIGITSLFAWMERDYIGIYYFFSEYRMPSSSYSLFYHLHIYLLPVSILMTWGYGILLKLKNWIIANK